MRKYEKNEKIKSIERIIWILILVIIISLIWFFVIIGSAGNQSTLPSTSFIPWIFIILSIIIFGIVYKIILQPLVEKAKQEYTQRIIDSKIIEALSYSESTKTLTVKKKDKNIREFLSAEQIYIDTRDKKPDSLVFTSVTVGGVTTGGLEKVEGKTTTRKTPTGAYKLIYSEMKDDGSFVKKGEVEYISLSSDLLNIAKKDLEEYILDDKIALLDESIKAKREGSAGTMMLQAAMSAGGLTYAGNYGRLMDTLEYPDIEKISKIIKWLAGDDIKENVPSENAK